MTHKLYFDQVIIFWNKCNEVTAKLYVVFINLFPIANCQLLNDQKNLYLILILIQVSLHRAPFLFFVCYYPSKCSELEVQQGIGKVLVMAVISLLGQRQIGTNCEAKVLSFLFYSILKSQILIDLMTAICSCGQETFIRL